MPLPGTSVIKPTVVTSHEPHPHFPKSHWPLLVRLWKGKMRNGRSLAELERTSGQRDRDTLKPPTDIDTQSPTPSTSSKGDSAISYVEHLRNQKFKYEPSFEKSDNLQQLKDALKSKVHQDAGKNCLFFLRTVFPCCQTTSYGSTAHSKTISTNP